MAFYILADNQELSSFALEQIIRRDATSVIYKATDKAGLVQLLKEHESAVVLLDYTLFDFVDVEQVLIVSERFVLSKWLLISDELSPSFLRKVVYTSHMFSVVFKDCALSEIRTAVESVAHQGRYICQQALEGIIQQKQEDDDGCILTATEREIVIAIAQGKTTKEIAAERFSSIHTVTTHRKNIFRKLQVNTAHEVVKYALRAGLIDQSEFYI